MTEPIDHEKEAKRLESVEDFLMQAAALNGMVELHYLQDSALLTFSTIANLYGVSNLGSWSTSAKETAQIYHGYRKQDHKVYAMGYDMLNLESIYPHPILSRGDIPVLCKTPGTNLSFEIRDPWLLYFYTHEGFSCSGIHPSLSEILSGALHAAAHGSSDPENWPALMKGFVCNGYPYSWMDDKLTMESLRMFVTRSPAVRAQYWERNEDNES